MPLKKVGLLLAAVLVIGMLYSPSATIAYSSNFDAFAPGTLVENLAVPGMTFTSGSFGDWNVWSPTTFANMSGLQAEGCFSPLSINFATTQATFDFDYGTSFASPVNVALYLGGMLVSSAAYNGTVILTFPEGHVTMAPAGGFDSAVIAGSSCIAIDNISTTDPVTGSLGYDKINQVRVTGGGTALYRSAGGGVVRDASGNEIWLPNVTADNPHMDVYDVVDIVEIDGQTWVQIFLGDLQTYPWIPLGPDVVIIN